MSELRQHLPSTKLFAHAAADTQDALSKAYSQQLGSPSKAPRSICYLEVSTTCLLSHLLLGEQGQPQLQGGAGWTSSWSRNVLDRLEWAGQIGMGWTDWSGPEKSTRACSSSRETIFLRSLSQIHRWVGSLELEWAQ